MLQVLKSPFILGALYLHLSFLLFLGVLSSLRVARSLYVYFVFVKRIFSILIKCENLYRKIAIRQMLPEWKYPTNFTLNLSKKYIQIYFLLREGTQSSPY